LQSLLAVEQEALSCKEARHKVYHKAGIYSKAAMEEPLILLYKKTLPDAKHIKARSLRNGKSLVSSCLVYFFPHMHEFMFGESHRKP